MPNRSRSQKFLDHILISVLLVTQKLGVAFLNWDFFTKVLTVTLESINVFQSNALSFTICFGVIDARLACFSRGSGECPFLPSCNTCKV